MLVMTVFRATTVSFLAKFTTDSADLAVAWRKMCGISETCCLYSAAAAAAEAAAAEAAAAEAAAAAAAAAEAAEAVAAEAAAATTTTAAAAADGSSSTTTTATIQHSNDRTELDRTTLRLAPMQESPVPSRTVTEP